eukprot:9496630-Pyramimonas_sp.AAC.1
MARVKAMVMREARLRMGTGGGEAVDEKGHRRRVMRNEIAIIVREPQEDIVAAIHAMEDEADEKHRSGELADT